jgi:membrane-bound lytic murein transglycosylase B
MTDPTLTIRRPKTLVGTLLLACIGSLTALPSYADDSYAQRSEVRRFMDELAAEHAFDRAYLERLFAGVQRQSRVLEAIARPAEGKPWFEYRKIFLTPERIDKGVAFWRENTPILQKAEQIYGVPAQIIVAIIGVETLYGRHMGRYPVLDSLTTLSFDYPPRARFFRSELEQLLLLAREESLDAVTLKGSYAGAMGRAQFIPSSYRRFAVDFDDDGVRDLWNSNADAIGSVANYFRRHGWSAGERVALPARVTGRAYRALVAKGIKPSIKPVVLGAHGVTPQRGQLDGAEVALMEFELEDAKQYWIGLNNFYVITRYNHSPLYAMAAYQLSARIKAAYEGQEG